MGMWDFFTNLPDDIKQQWADLQNHAQQTGTHLPLPMAKPALNQKPQADAAAINSLHQQLVQPRTAGTDKAIPVPYNQNVSSGDAASADLHFQNLVKKLFKSEGPLNNGATDIGGLTNMGLTDTMYKRFRAQGKYTPWPESVDKLSRKQIENVMYHEYYKRYNVDKIAAIKGIFDASPNLAYNVQDMVVMHSPGAFHVLQKAINAVTPGTRLAEDGVIGSQTIAAIAKLVHEGKARVLNNTLQDARQDYLDTVVKQNHPNQYIQNIRGWRSRLDNHKDKQQMTPALRQ